jgi:hypothetical protein
LEKTLSHPVRGANPYYESINFKAKPETRSGFDFDLSTFEL